MEIVNAESGSKYYAYTKIGKKQAFADRDEDFALVGMTDDEIDVPLG